MEISGENSLIVVGAWNPAILSPAWILEEVLGYPSVQDVPVQMEFASVPGTMPKVTIEGISYTPALDRFNLYPNELTDARLTSVENQVSRILEIVPHTPVRAFGENFEFVERSPTPEQLRIFNLQGNQIQECNFINELHSVNIKQSYVVDDCILNLNQNLQDGVLSIKFNFHYEVNNATTARERLGNTYVTNLRRALSFIEIYGDVPESLNWALEERVGE